MEKLFAGDWSVLRHLVTADRALAGLRAVLVVGILLLLLPLLRRAVTRLMSVRWAPQQVMLARRVVTYAVYALAVTMGLRELGFQLGVLLGAAGVASVAVGFASQTSVSNIISGLFLIGERAFVIGDNIIINGITGEVLAVDLLSVKLRTMDNLYVRIPNEIMLKSAVTNLTRFPIRRFDMTLGVAYKEDIARVRSLLMQAAERNPLGLEDPKPLFIFQGYGDSDLQMQFSVWCKRENFVDLKNSLYTDIKNLFDANGVEIPFPQRALVASSDGIPIPVRLCRDNPEKPEITVKSA